MERLREVFKRKEKLLVAYLMAGYPSLEDSLEAFTAVLEGGADVLEVGFPFSDPVADGPTIQRAHEEALKRGVRLRELFGLLSELRRRFPSVPMLVMTYYNPIFRKGTAAFAEELLKSGGDGLIVPDLPPEEAGPLREELIKRGLAFVPLAAPTSTERRLKLICESAAGMVYFVSVLGTTGERDELPLERIREKLESYRRLCSEPAVVGFGVSRPEQARAVAALADGVVVGSALVKLAGRRDFKALKELTRSLKEACRAA